MQIVILAGGKATRLYPLTKSIPKSMIPIFEKPFFLYQIELLRRNKIEDIVMCVGIFADQIMNYFGDGRKFGVSIKYSIEDPNHLLGTAGALRNAQKYLKDVFFVMYGDSYLPIDFSNIFEYFRNLQKDGLMTIYRNNNNFDKSNVDIDKDLIVTYDKSGSNEKLEYIDYGLLVLQKKILDVIPQDQFVDLDFLINYLIERKQLASYEVHERFYEIGTSEGIIDFETHLKARNR